MMPFRCLLVPLDGSVAAARSLDCAISLARSLHAKLHILSATSRRLPPREELARLRVPEAHWPFIILHQAPRFPEDAILQTAAEYGVDLIVMSAQGETAEQAPPGEAARHAPGPFAVVGHVTRAVIERSPVPVLLLPPSYRKALQWKHVVVPVSGEVEADRALNLAVNLANAMNLELHVVHVLSGPARERGLAAAARYADALHYEYPQQLAELVRRTLPHLPFEQCGCISEIGLCRGDVAAELIDQVEKKEASLLVVGWHGCFSAGRAEVVKELLKTITCPILLVKAARRPHFTLKVGPAFA